MDFDELSETLIAGAASARLDRDVGDDYDNPNELLPDIDMPSLSGSLSITIPPLHSSFLSSQATQLKRTCIPMEILFEYPTDTDCDKVMNSFWKGGIENLEKKMETYKILNLNEEALDGIQPDILTSVDFV